MHDSAPRGTGRDAYPREENLTILAVATSCARFRSRGTGSRSRPRSRCSRTAPGSLVWSVVRHSSFLQQLGPPRRDAAGLVVLAPFGHAGQGAVGELLEQRPDPGRLSLAHRQRVLPLDEEDPRHLLAGLVEPGPLAGDAGIQRAQALLEQLDRKSTRLNSSHVKISYAVFCLKKKKKKKIILFSTYIIRFMD